MQLDVVWFRVMVYKSHQNTIFNHLQSTFPRVMSPSSSTCSAISTLNKSVHLENITVHHQALSIIVRPTARLSG